MTRRAVESWCGGAVKTTATGTRNTPRGSNNQGAIHEGQPGSAQKHNITCTKAPSKDEVLQRPSLTAPTRKPPKK